MKRLVTISLFLSFTLAAAHTQAASSVELPTNGQCVDFSPYVAGANPNSGSHPSATVIDGLLDTLVAQTGTNCITVYGVLNGLGYTFQAAQQRGLTVTAIVWLSDDTAVNNASIAAGIQYAKQYPSTITHVSCGSEVRTRLHQATAESVVQNCLTQLRANQVTQPIGSIDTWWQWCNESVTCEQWGLANSLDWLGVNVFPWWENQFSGLYPCTTAAEAADFHIARLQQIRARYPGKQTRLSEFGWPAGPDGFSPTNGGGQHCGVASEANQRLVVNSTIAKLNALGFLGAVFEAFREPWKGTPGGEGVVGPFWGVIPISISIGDASVAEGNSGTASATFAITLSAPSEQTVTVSASTSNGSALAGSDFTATGPTTVTFAPGSTTQNFSVPVLGDVTSESNETFFVNLASPINAPILDGVAVGTITNDDAPAPSRLFVSNNGSDGNVCSTQTTPCRNLAAAVDQVAIDGEVIVLTSGEYESAPLVITRGVKITSPSGTVAFVRQPITVSAPGGRVVLRGLTLKGAGVGNALTLTAADSLSLEESTIDRWAIGLSLNNTTTAQVFVSNSVFRGSGSGIQDSGGAAGNRVSIEESRFEGNTKGVEVLSRAFMVRESAFVGNSGSGVAAGPGSVDIQRSEFSMNNIGVSALSGGTVRIGRSRLSANTIGLSAAAGSTVESAGTNVMRGNVVNTTGTITPTPEG